MEDSCYVSIPPENGGKKTTCDRSIGGSRGSAQVFPPPRAHVSWPACGHPDNPVTADSGSSLLAPEPSHSIVRSHYSYFASSPRRMSLQEPAAGRGSRGKQSVRSSGVFWLHAPQAPLQSEGVPEDSIEGDTVRPPPEGSGSAWGTEAEASIVADSGGTRDEGRSSGNLSVCQKVAHTAFSVVKQTHLIVMGILIAVLDNMPYATLLFPSSYAYLVPLGATAILTTTAVSQVVMALFSVFPFAVGAFTIENVPFLKCISVAAIQNAAAKGLSDEWVVSTILMCWMVASFLTAATFYFLGALKLGRVADYIPNTVLLGCIGGMGLFMVSAALGVAAGCEWEWNSETFATVLSASAFPCVCLTLLVEVILILAEVKYASPTFTPIFLLAFPVMFYAALFFFGISVERARESGWIFGWATTPGAADEEQPSPLVASAFSAAPLGDLGASVALPTEAVGRTAASARLQDSHPAGLSSGGKPANTADQLSIYSQFSIGCVDWHCVLSQAPSIIAIVVFSVLHAPINVPSLTLTSGIPSSLDYELKVHGLASLAAALTGGLQCYMTYSTSTLFWKCGVREHAASLFVGLGTIALLFTLSPNVILIYFPRPAAAVFMCHVGVVLVNDGLIASRSIVSFAEYVVIIITAAAMQSAFTDGLIVGLGLSAALKVFHVVVAAMRSRRWLS